MVWHGAGGLSDERRVPGIGLGLTRVENDSRPHGQSVTLSDRYSHVLSYGQGQCPDRGGLFDDREHRAVVGDVLDEDFEPYLVLRRGLVQELLPTRSIEMA